jgi:membrane peptidoglycan carboxypeptidase
MENGGYTIKTTLDWPMQQKAEELAKKYAEINEKKYNASNNGLVAIDPTTGQILAMVGSRDYFDKTIDGAYNIATADRQPGSSFKPFVYATAFAEGYTPETVLFDLPTEFSTNCSADRTPLPGHTIKDCYHPDNFDNKFKGPISLRSAISESRNIPSVKLLYLVGTDSAVDTAHKLGITTLQDPKEIGLSLVLGGGEVKLIDMVGAYGVFANSGTRNPTTGILEVKDHSGTIVEQFESSPSEVFDKNAALTLNDVLSDPEARKPTFPNNIITIPGVAVKTGTTNEDRDAWIIGYTPNLVVGVWSGNNDNKRTTGGGSAISGPFWKEFMQAELPTLPAVSFEKPIPDADYDSLKPILRGKWNEDISAGINDILYYIKKSDPRGPAPSNPYSDPQFHLWNPPVQTWAAANYGLYPSTPTATPSYDTTAITINGLPSSMKATDTASVTVGTNGTNPLQSVDVYLNNNYITTLASPFHFTFTPKEYGYLPGSYLFRVIGTNSVSSKTTAEQPLTLE